MKENSKPACERLKTIVHDLGIQANGPDHPPRAQPLSVNFTLRYLTQLLDEVNDLRQANAMYKELHDVTTKTLELAADMIDDAKARNSSLCSESSLPGDTLEQTWPERRRGEKL